VNFPERRYRVRPSTPPPRRLAIGLRRGMTRRQAADHHNADGLAKRAFRTTLEASRFAGSRPGTFRRTVRLYRCSWCGLLHWGSVKDSTLRRWERERALGEALGLELDERALVHVLAENHGTARDRRRVIRNRFLSAERKARQMADEDHP
jgi:hypothetical protein